MNPDLPSLLERVERASGADREIDLEIGLALGGWKHLEPDARGDEYLKADDCYYPWPPSPGQLWPSPTESLDAALALMELVRPGRQWQVNSKSDGTAFAVVETTEPGNRFQRHDAATPALALLAALLKSLIAEPTDAR